MPNCNCPAINPDELDIFSLPLDCSATWDLIKQGRVKGCFQIEKNLGQHWSKEISPNSISDLGALIALIRPACLEAITDGKNATKHYADRKNGKEEIKLLHKELEEILKDTFQLMIFQEQSIAAVKKLANFDLKEADELRKCVTGDTAFVSKKRGWITIDRLLKEGYKDDLFLIMNENGEQSWKEIDEIWYTGRHDVITVESNCGFKVKATKNHQFLTNSGWKARQRLKLDDYLVGVRRIEYDGEDKISPELAFVIAGVVCEGYFASQDGSHFTNYDKEMMEWFLDNFNKVFNEPPNTNDSKVARLKRDHCHKINDYINYGLAATKALPDEMMGMTIESTRKFLSFMLACEGGVCKSGAFGFSSKSYQLAWQVKLLLLRFGIRSNTQIKTNPEYRIFYDISINCLVDQKIMFRDLTDYWPKWKKKDLETIINNKSESGFNSHSIPTDIITKFIDQYPSAVNYESGKIYKSNVTFTRFQKLVQRTQDKFWYKFSNGKQTYVKVEKLDEWYKQRKTYDFRMKDEDCPYIIANGLVIHNSMGKKDTESMAKVKAKFLTKAKEYGLISDEDALYIFEIIEKSQRYNFNASHAISYANYSYISAYIKTHFPLEFFCSWLTFAGDKPNPKLETKQLINDAKTFNINILNPYLPDFAEHCYIADADKNIIRFGIVDIAGIGANTFNKIKKIKFSKPIREISWLEFLVLHSDKIDQTSMKALIGAGALDYMNANARISRQRMLYEYDKWLKLTDKEIDWINQNLKTTITSENKSNPSIDDISSLVYILKKLAPIKKNGGGTNSVNREKVVLDLIKLLENPPHSLQDTVDWVIEEEERLLGIALSQSRLTAADIGIASNTTIDEFNKGKNAHQMIIAANIDSARVVKIKRGKSAGSDMAFISLSDDSGSMDAVAFSECWAEYSRLLAEGRSVMVSGNRDKNKGSFIINKVWSL